MGRKVFGDTGGVGLHGLLARLPSGWAHFSVFVGELESLDQPQGFVHVTADWKVIDRDLKHKLS